VRLSFEWAYDAPTKNAVEHAAAPAALATPAPAAPAAHAAPAAPAAAPVVPATAPAPAAAADDFFVDEDLLLMDDSLLQDDDDVDVAGTSVAMAGVKGSSGARGKVMVNPLLNHNRFGTPATSGSPVSADAPAGWKAEGEGDEEDVLFADELFADDAGDEVGLYKLNPADP
jgi:hypothetical protein